LLLSSETCIPPCKWRNFKNIISINRKKNLDPETAHVWIVFQSLDSFRVHIPSFQPSVTPMGTSTCFYQVVNGGTYDFTKTYEYLHFIENPCKRAKQFKIIIQEALQIGMAQVRQRNVGGVKMYHNNVDTRIKIST